MAANKAEFIAILSAKAGITIAEATAATESLPEAFGEWLKTHGASAPGQFNGSIEDGLNLEMTRSVTPAPHWTLKVTMSANGLNDFGDGAARFGLAVENA